MEKLSRVLENPAVQKAGKIGIAIVGAVTLVKAGQWAWRKSEGFRSEIKAEFNRVRAEIKAANSEKAEVVTEEAKATTQEATA